MAKFSQRTNDDLSKMNDQVNNLFDQASLQGQNLEMSEVSNYGFDAKA